MKILLASQSPSRKKLLKKIGLIFKTFSPNIEEHKFIDSKNPKISSLKVAQQKALKAQSLYKTACIIACDQIAYIDQTICYKAHTQKKAKFYLNLLQGRTHTLFTGLYMLYGKKSYSYVCESQLRMRKLSEQQIQNYILKDQALYSAGSYHIESQGLQLFEHIKTEDFNAIEGLPLIKTINQLVAWGLPIFKSTSHKYFV